MKFSFKTFTFYPGWAGRCRSLCKFREAYKFTEKTSRVKQAIWCHMCFSSYSARAPWPSQGTSVTIINVLVLFFSPALIQRLLDNLIQIYVIMPKGAILIVDLIN